MFCLFVCFFRLKILSSKDGACAHHFLTGAEATGVDGEINVTVGKSPSFDKNNVSGWNKVMR